MGGLFNMNYLQRLQLCRRILREPLGNLFAHADRELPKPETDDTMQALMNAQLKELLLVFSTHGHSGSSASYAITILERLLRYAPIGPLKGTPEEWREATTDLLQNRRCSRVFKEKSTGLAYDIAGKVFREPSGACYTSRESRVTVTFPYTPTTVYVDVDLNGRPLNGSAL